MKKIILKLTLLLLFSLPLSAENYIGSDVRLLSKDIVLSDVSSSSTAVSFKHGNEGRRLDVSIDQAFLSSDWALYSFTFTPSASGQINIEFRGTEGAPETQYVAYDTISVQGAVLKNGGFEEFAEGKPNPKFWWGEFTAEQVFKDPNHAQSGTTFALARHDRPFRTNFKVTANQPVTIFYFVKRVMLETAK
jgi:hypothetical protein